MLTSALVRGVTTACLTFCISDTACQTLERRCSPPEQRQPRDFRRTLNFVSTALIFNGPASVAIIAAVDSLPLQTAAMKAIVNMAVEPARIGGTLVTFQLLSGQGFKGALELLQAELWNIYTKGLLLWTPALWISYRFLSLRDRAPFLYLLGAFWDTFVSYRANQRDAARLK